MVDHIVMWNFLEEMNEEERREAGEQIRQKLEAVKDSVEGVLSLEVRINKLPSSNKDVALISRFESVEALDAYQVHPAHIQAGSYIKTVTRDRVCFDHAD